MKVNTRPVGLEATTNHHGVTTDRHTTPFERLRRTVCACLLWEDGFYESGVTVADRIAELVPQCLPHEVAQLAIELRTKGNLRHVPMLLVRELARDSKRYSVAPVLEQIILRADELAEFLAIYWKDGKKPIAKQVKLGLARAFCRFDEYQLAKYNRESEIKLRDVLFLVHAKPKDIEQALLWERLVKKELATADTWETRLSGGADKKASFTEMLQSGKMGYLALLRNLRNMHQAGVDATLVEAALNLRAGASKVLPFRYIAAARAVPQWEDMIDRAMQMSLDGMKKLPGHTVVLVDNSPSMDAMLSSKSDLSRKDAAGALAILLRGICEKVTVISFSNEAKVVPPRNGMALVDAIHKATRPWGTAIGAALKFAAVQAPTADRLIIFTDEESQDQVGQPHCPGYMVNVASTERSVASGAGWRARITGFSEAVVQYIVASEELDAEFGGKD